MTYNGEWEESYNDLDIATPCPAYTNMSTKYYTCFWFKTQHFLLNIEQWRWVARYRN